MPLSDDQLCILNNLLYHDALYESMKQRYAHGQTHATLSDVLSEVEKLPMPSDQYTSKEEWRTLIEAAKNDVSLRDLHVYDIDTNTSQGARNVCFTDQDGHPYVVMKGTGSDSNNKESEWPDNCNGLSQSDTEQQVEARAYVEYVHNKTGKDVTVTGHSKGGNKSMYCAVTLSFVDKCVSFDGQGFGSDFIAKYGSRIDQRKNSITNYRTEGDYVSSLLNSVAGNNVYIQSSRLGNVIGTSYLSNHAPIKLLDENMRLGKIGRQSQGSKEINQFTTWLDTHAFPEDRQPLASLLGELTHALLGNGDIASALQRISTDNPQGVALLLGYLLEYPDIDNLLTSVLSELLATPITTLTDTEVDSILNSITQGTLRTFLSAILPEAAFTLGALHLILSCAHGIRNLIRSFGRGEQPYSPLESPYIHDFSDAKLQELIAIIHDIKCEPFYDVSRWDDWYRGERWFGRLNIDKYQNDLQSHYRKMLDIQNASENEIRKRFKQAEDMDASYSRKILTIAQNVSNVGSMISAYQYGL